MTSRVRFTCDRCGASIPPEAPRAPLHVRFITASHLSPPASTADFCVPCGDGILRAMGFDPEHETLRSWLAKLPG